MASVQGQIQFAVRLAQSGQFKAARDTLASALKKDAKSVEALALLGRIAALQQDYDASLDAFKKAVVLAPRRDDLLFDLGNMLAMADDLTGAVDALSKACALAPRKADHHYNLGCACAGLGDHRAAVGAFRAAVALKPDMAEGWESLGQSALAMGDWDAAIPAYQRLLDLTPQSEDAIIRLSIALRSAGRHADADALKNDAIAQDPGSSLARQLIDMTTGQWKGAVGEQDLVAAHLADPLAPDPVCDLAEYLEKRSRLPELLPQLIASAVENGDHARVMTMTGQALIETGDFSEQTESILLHADALGGQTHKPCNALGYLYERRGNLPEAAKWYRKAHEHDPTIGYFHSNLLFALRHSARLTPEELFTEHRRYGEIQEPLHDPLPLPALTAADADRRLRIGFVSGDFCAHPVTMFFEPYLDHLDRSQFHVTLYYTLRPVDKTTERLRDKADRWRQIANLSADDAARLVQTDGIDILIDLAGHTAGNGLPVFVRKPAHLQMTWLGYPGTSGLSRMDYRLTDHGSDPCATAPSLHVEKLLYIPGTTFRPPPACPPVAPPPVLETGFITFGSFNRPSKISDACFRLWGEILARTPGSRLVMVASAREIDTIRAQVGAHLKAAGVDPARLDLHSRLPLADFMALLGTVDIALDPFPYSGGTTSLLTLWMGVPFVTLAGTDGASRGGQETLGAVRAPELIGQTGQDYVEIAVALAADLPRLTMLRSELRARLMLSPGLQEADAVGRFAEVLRQAWRDHVRTVQSQDAPALQSV